METVEVGWPVGQLVCLGFIEGGGAGEAEGEESGETAEGFCEAGEGERLADEGEVEVSEVLAFGEGWEAVDAVYKPRGYCQWVGYSTANGQTDSRERNTRSYKHL